MPIRLAALLLTLGVGLLLFSFFYQSHATYNRQSALELADTVEQLSTLVSADPVEWAQSDQLAQLAASADVQVSRLAQLNEGVFGFLASDTNTESVREIGADWKLLREGLLALNKASFKQNNQTVLPETAASNGAVDNQTSEATAATDTQTHSVETDATDTGNAEPGVPQELITLAQSFASIGSSINEGTRLQPLIDLVDDVSISWVPVINGQAAALPEIVAQQKTYADELLQLSGAGTQNSLFGYYTANRIIDYAQQVKGIQLPESEPQPKSQPEPQVTPIPPAAVELASTSAVDAKDSTLLSSAFVSGTLVSLQESVAGLLALNRSEADDRSMLNWIGMASVATSALLLLFALSRMMRAVEGLKPVRNAPLPATPQVVRGAMSVREADQLIEDINSVVGGDLRRPIAVPERGHAKAIAERVNRSGKVIGDLVGMTRGVATRLNRLVKKQEQHSRVLAELDIRRQTDIAELSEAVSLRSGYLKQQHQLVSRSNGLTKEIENRSNSAVKGANQVSASIATMSAQIEVGIERMQRLLKTADSVTQATGKLKQLTEKTRLQALNISLKVPSMSRDTTMAYDEFDSYTETLGSNISSDGTVELFDDIHQLTGRLVQVSNETDILIGALQKDIQETASALQQSSTEMNESAHHTHSTSLLGKELASYIEQLRGIVAETLQNIDVQKNELSETATRIVQIDKAGNNYSDLTLTLSQDLAGLKQMSSRLEESVSSFKIEGEAQVE